MENAEKAHDQDVGESSPWHDATDTIFYFECSDYDTLSLHRIDSTIFLSLSEGFAFSEEVQRPKLEVNLVTTKIYPCANWSILGCTRFDKHLDVSIAGVYEPISCLTSIAPAAMFLNYKQSEKSFQIHLFNNNAIDQYDVLVSKQAIVVRSKVSTFSFVRDTLMWRYPEKSFAYICGTYTTNTWIYQDFKDSLESAVPLTPIVFPSIGVSPYPTKSNGRYVEYPSVCYTYSDSNDISVIRELLKRYAKNKIKNEIGTGIEIITWDNNHLLSWVLENQ